MGKTRNSKLNKDSELNKIVPLCKKKSAGGTDNSPPTP